MAQYLYKPLIQWHSHQLILKIVAIVILYDKVKMDNDAPYGLLVSTYTLAFHLKVASTGN